MIYAPYCKLSKELKNGIKISIGQAIFKLWLKTFKMMFGSKTQNRLAYLTFDAIFEFFVQFTLQSIYYFSRRCW